MNFKYISTIFIFLSTFIQTYAVQIVQQSEVSVAETSSAGLKTFIIWFFSAGVMILGTILFFFLLAVIIMKIQKKMSDFMRKKKDFLFSNFEENLTQCHLNRDYQMKFRRMRSVWLLWNRNGVYMNTKAGLEQIGDYDGESYKKEGYFFLALNNKMSFFKSKQTIIVFPLTWYESIFKKAIVNKKKIIIIDCEGLDEVGSTDYYFQPLKKDKDGAFLDISDKFRTEFTEPVVYRDLIKEELQGHKEAVIKAVESNPYLHQQRRKE